MDIDEVFGKPELIHQQTHYSELLNVTQETSLYKSSVESDCYYLEQVTFSKDEKRTSRVYLTIPALQVLLPALNKLPS